MSIFVWRNSVSILSLTEFLPGILWIMRPIFITHRSVNPGPDYTRSYRGAVSQCRAVFHFRYKFFPPKKGRIFFEERKGMLIASLVVAVVHGNRRMFLNRELRRSPAVRSTHIYPWMNYSTKNSN